jgi:putative transcriptional regulator
MATKARNPEADILTVVHESVAGCARSAWSIRETMRHFGALCLTTVERLSPEEIRALREREQVSQPVFARYLNVRTDAVSKWERGEKRPDDPFLKLLNLVKAKGLAAIA